MLKLIFNDVDEFLDELPNVPAGTVFRLVVRRRYGGQFAQVSIVCTALVPQRWQMPDEPPDGPVGLYEPCVLTLDAACGEEFAAQSGPSEASATAQATRERVAAVLQAAGFTVAAGVLED